MTDEKVIRGLILGVVVKVLIVVGIGTAIAFWYLSTL